MLNFIDSFLSNRTSNRSVWLFLLPSICVLAFLCPISKIMPILVRSSCNISYGFWSFFLYHDWCLAHRSEDFDECFKLIVCFDQNLERVWLQFDAVTNVLIVKTKGHLCEYIF